MAPQASAFPAPPPASPAWAPRYEPLGRSTSAITALAVAMVPLLGLALLAHGLILTSLVPGGFGEEATAADAGAEGPPPAGFFAAFGAVFALFFLNGAVSLAQAIVVGLWAQRASRNAGVFGAAGMSWSPGWGIGGWFIPYANLVIPLLVLREVWRASAPDAAPPFGWRSASVPSWVGWWWGLWVAMSVGPGFLFVATDFAIIGGLLPQWTLALPLAVSLGVGAAALALFLRFVRALAARQEEAARRRGLWTPSPT